MALQLQRVTCSQASSSSNAWAARASAAAGEHIPVLLLSWRRERSKIWALQAALLLVS